MESLRKAAAQALRALADAGQPSAGEIERASFEVRVGAGSELVSMRALSGKLDVSCSCGARGCAHALAALRLAAGDPERLLAREPVSRSLAPRPPAISITPDRRDLGSAPEHRVSTRASGTGALDLGNLVEALEDLITAIVRRGVADPAGVSVHDTLERLVRSLPTPPPIGLARFVGRLRQALEARDASTCARLLAAAGQWIDDVRSHRRDGDAAIRASAWLDVPLPNPERLTDCSLLEIARETVSGATRGQIERRYLIDLESGETLREDRLRRSADASIGPCPRLLAVGLAELLPGSPRRARLLQYSVSTSIGREVFRQLEAHAERDFGKLAEAHRAQVERFAGLYEPFVVLAPKAYAADAQPTLIDGSERGIALHAEDDVGVLRRIEDLLAPTGSAAPPWIAGRLLDRKGTLVLRPLALGILRGDASRHERL